MLGLSNFLSFKQKKSSDDVSSKEYIIKNVAQLHNKMINEYKIGNIAESKKIYKNLLDERKKLLYFDYECHGLDYAMLLLIGVNYFNETEQNINEVKKILAFYPNIHIDFLNDQIQKLNL